MLKQDTRTAILELVRKGHGIRSIAQALRVSRPAVKRVIQSGNPEPQPLQRPEKAEAFREEIAELLIRCRGNKVRVHEELLAEGADISYQGLTAFCRRHNIGTKSKEPVGSYEFGPGSEMQHDTSLHRADMGGKLRPVQTASLVLCFSRMLFFQFYPHFRRFECKVFLAEGARYMQGVCPICMIDNTHVVVLRGSGANMIVVPEMEAFATRLGFQFRAHRIGDANRSGRVERPFSFIKNNFLAGRKFSDWIDINQKAREWCDRVNQTFKRHLNARPVDLYASERVHLRPLPIHLPDPVEILHRIVDCERYVSVDRNRYSVAPEFIGRTVEVHQSFRQIHIYQGGRLIATHDRIIDALGERVLLTQHHFPKQRPRSQERQAEEQTLLNIVPEIAPYLSELKKQGRTTAFVIRRLIRMAREYPREPFSRALSLALHYRLFDMERLESLVLRHIANDYFQIDPGNKGDDNDES